MAQAQTNEIFNNLPQDKFKLFKGNSVKGEEIVKILDWKRREVSQASGVKSSAIRYDARMPQELKERMREWATVINLVAEFFDDKDKTMRWLFTSNPFLGEQTPRDMIRLGRSKKLIKFIRSALSENQLSKKG